MTKNISLFWPGDGRRIPNELAQESAEKATQQLEAALRKIGKHPQRVPGFISKPHESIEKLSHIDDPLIAVCVHWFYATHTTEGVVGKKNPLLLASNFSGQWPGLVGLLNTAASLESLDRPFSRIWTDAADWTNDSKFMERLEHWCDKGALAYAQDEISDPPAISPEAEALATTLAKQIRDRRILILMFGDTSMGMINGYFGPRLLHRYGFGEHKIDQAWIIDRGKKISDARIDDAFRFVRDKGVTFHWREKGAEDFDENATREQLRDYLAVLDLANEYKADCIGWQYQLGLISLRPPSDFCGRPLQLGLPPGIERRHAHLFDRSRSRQRDSDGVDETHPESEVAPSGSLLPRHSLGRPARRKIHLGTAQFGLSGAYAFNHDANSLRGVHSYRQPSLYFPVPGGTFAGESLPGKMTWARTYIRENELWMDIGRGEVVKLPPDVRDEWWSGTTRQWPFMAADLGISRDTLMAHYMSNHIAVAYGDIFGEMVALSKQLGFRVRILGSRHRHP